MERHEEQLLSPSYVPAKYLSFWRYADDRFFWNKILLADLIESRRTEQNTAGDLLNVDPVESCADPSKLFVEASRDKFILPIIQGFIQIETFENRLPVIVDTDKSTESGRSGSVKTARNSVQMRIYLISRRNRYRLGTRFKRRGVDENGNVANFVETEQVHSKFIKRHYFCCCCRCYVNIHYFYSQIINAYDSHTLSFVILRGSIPVFWSQPGMKYRPAPRIDKS